MLNFDLTLSSVIALGLAFALVLFRLTPLRRESDVRNSVPRMLGAVALLAISVSLVPVMFGIQPTGLVGDAVTILGSNRFERESPSVSNEDVFEEEKLDWHLAYGDAWKEAVRDRKRILIFFAAITSTNTRYCEINVLERTDVAAELRKYVRLRLYIDWVPDAKLSRAESARQARRNEDWGFSMMNGEYPEPAIIIFSPDVDAPLENGEPKGIVVATQRANVEDRPASLKFFRDLHRNAPRKR